MNLPNRKPTRLKEYDYSTPGAYFVTICTQNRKEILSSIIVGDGLPDVPENILSDYGKIAEKHINLLNEFYEYIFVDKYVIMPNHIHLLVQIRGDSVLGGHRGPPLHKIIGQFKSYTTHRYGMELWQRSYHDRIIRDDAEYDMIWDYIDTNPLRWELDCFYTEE